MTVTIITATTTVRWPMQHRTDKPLLHKDLIALSHVVYANPYYTLIYIYNIPIY